MMSLYWIAPSLPRETDWSCRSNRVMASEHLWSCDRCVQCLPFHFKNRNRNGSQRYCGFLSWSCFSHGFPRSYVLFFHDKYRFCHVLINTIRDSNQRKGIVFKHRLDYNFNSVLVIMIVLFFRRRHWFCHGPINAIYDSDPRNGIVLKQRWNLNFYTVMFITIANFLRSRLDRFSYFFWESILSHESSSRFEASYILGINVASPALLLYPEYGSIVLFRQASSPHQNIVWKFSVFWHLFEFPLVFLHQVSPLLCIGLSFSSRRASWKLHRFQMIIRCCRFPRSPKIFG